MVDTIEMPGAEPQTHHRAAGERLIVRTDESDAGPALGAKVYLRPRLERIHWVEATATKLIL